ncbi:MAG: exopolysaccharide biosynthesis protein [Firmicutes bacterium]|nr:exopolysaccharide biosynthesis protein [Bacillota bacterium]
MIYVSLGTQDKKFPRLLQEVDKLIDKGIIKDEVVAQIGQTEYESKNMKLYDYLSKEDVLKYMNESRFIICHGGVGTILDALKLNKKVIAVARLKLYKEHVNDHQLQIIREYTKLGYILDGTYDLEKAIFDVNEFIPNRYVSNNENFIKQLEDYIDNN